MSGWEREGDTLTAVLDDPDVGQYILRVGSSDRFDGWSAHVVHNGFAIHLSEHESRHEAQLAAEEALHRARKIRRLSP